MANWTALQEQLTGKRVIKRAKHSIHFDNGNGSITANFSGKPCHFQDTDGLWKPIDTRLLLGADGFYGCPHSPVKVHKDGRVKVDKSDYSQFTKLPGSPLGRVDGDKIVREFPGGYQELFVTEDGFREVITVVKRTFPIEKFLAKQSGTLPSAYKTSPQTAVDANGNEFVITSDTKAFGDWLEGAVYPVTIDPDFAGGANDATVNGYGAWATARATATQLNMTGDKLGTGQLYYGSYYNYRAFLLFDTSSIPDTATVTQVNMKLTVNTVPTAATAFDVQIVKCDWSGQNPITTDNMDAAYDACLSSTADDNIMLNTSGISVNTQYTSGNLSTAWVSKTGTTYYGLRSSPDANNSPIAEQHPYCEFYSANHSTSSYRPTLSVTYTASGGFHPINMTANMQSLTGGMRG